MLQLSEICSDEQGLGAAPGLGAAAAATGGRGSRGTGPATAGAVGVSIGGDNQGFVSDAGAREAVVAAGAAVGMGDRPTGESGCYCTHHSNSCEHKASLNDSRVLMVGSKCWGIGV